MITPAGKVVLIDFGISKIFKVENAGDTVNFGSKGYAEPEQSGVEQSCRQTDIYLNKFKKREYYKIVTSINNNRLWLLFCIIV